MDYYSCKDTHAWYTALKVADHFNVTLNHCAFLCTCTGCKEHGDFLYKVVLLQHLDGESCLNVLAIPDLLHQSPLHTAGSYHAT